jgi:hypothetical protein
MTRLAVSCFLGNDPLTDEENNHDINSVAGVLKLYFRGLENPLFPKERFNDLLSCIRKHPKLFPFLAHVLSFFIRKVTLLVTHYDGRTLLPALQWLC